MNVLMDFELFGSAGAAVATPVAITNTATRATRVANLAFI